MRYNNTIKFISLTSTILLLSGCGMAGRITNVGKAPDLSPIENPAETGEYRQVSMPMPQVETIVKEKNSLWASNRQTFFKDQRANNVGDILTVMIDIKDKADLKNESERNRNSDENVGLNSLLGIESQLTKVLPETVTGANLVDATSDSRFKGTGKTKREEKVEMKLAATVTQILPNGNMLIQGRQEVRVNFEKRILELAGIIRPEDISTENSIPYEKIAEARISYGGKGQITDFQQPRYGQQVYDILFPF